MKALFLDESGDHNLAVVDPQYPLFVLGGVIVEMQYARTELQAELEAFKRDLFGRTDIVLHTADIVRNRNGFEAMKDPEFRTHFMVTLNALMERLRYTVVACVIRKAEHRARYGAAAFDPYHMSLEVLVERLCFEVGDARFGGVIVAEKRGDPLDRDLKRAWMDLQEGGTRFTRGPEIVRRILSMQLRAKEENVAGLQLADLVVSPIGRYVLGKPCHDDWRIVRSRLRRGRNGAVEGYGLVVLPR